MTGTRDRFGEVIEPIEPDDNLRDPGPTGRTRDQIHRERCAQLRAILAAARARRKAQR